MEGTGIKHGLLDAEGKGRGGIWESKWTGDKRTPNIRSSASP